MSNQDQERFEDYLEVEQYIEDLRADRKGELPESLSPDQARVYGMAALFRSAMAENAAPRPEFFAKLQNKLAQQEAQQQHTEGVPAQEEVPQEKPEEKPVLPQQEIVAPAVAPDTGKRPEQISRRPRVSRRSLLTGGAVAAASLAVGTVAGAAFERPQPEKPPQQGAATTTPDWPVSLVGAGVPVRWMRTIHLEQLGKDAQRFQSESVIGYLMRSDDEAVAAGSPAVIALSAACTHMGCLVRWQKSERNFVCPCHGGLFTEYGEPARNSPLLYLHALPRLNTKVGDDGYVYVEVPVISE